MWSNKSARASLCNGSSDKLKTRRLLQLGSVFRGGDPLRSYELSRHGSRGRGQPGAGAEDFPSPGVSGLGAEVPPVGVSPLPRCGVRILTGDAKVPSELGRRDFEGPCQHSGRHFLRAPGRSRPVVSADGHGPRGPSGPRGQGSMTTFNCAGSVSAVRSASAECSSGKRAVISDSSSTRPVAAKDTAAGNSPA